LENLQELKTSEEEYKVEAIVSYQQVWNKLLFRVRWKSYGPKESSSLTNAAFQTPQL
jgi:hypothetical protein